MKANKGKNRFSSVAADVKQVFNELTGQKRLQSIGSKIIESRKDSSSDEDDQIMFEERKSAASIRSPRSSIDATNYYKRQDEETHATDIVGECYLNFSKLLQSEMRNLDKRNSQILETKMSISLKKSVSLRSRGGELIIGRKHLSDNQMRKRLIESKPFTE